eukprot:TRINITY_DN9515_c0_g2_i1.p1 TRINITY_DN9515_c0_g2~~TRINITY_DN9515_c0_g2_i1.p1  ORF type:complete len:148 (-),score=9.58 TRINITY_DN9515_c0_g2_i1:13-456(-)
MAPRRKRVLEMFTQYLDVFDFARFKTELHRHLDNLKDAHLLAMRKKSYQKTKISVRWYREAMRASVAAVPAEEVGRRLRKLGYVLRVSGSEAPETATCRPYSFFQDLSYCAIPMKLPHLKGWTQEAMSIHPVAVKDPEGRPGGNPQA